MGKEKLEFPFNSFYKGTSVVVKGYFEDIPKEELEDGAVYIYRDCVWMYKEKYPKSPQKYPTIWLDFNDEVITTKSILNETITLESVLNDRLKIICEHTTDDMDFSKDISVVPAASSTAVYLPEIKESDDFFKKILKTVFLIKKTATAAYRKKLSKAYAFSNLFQGLNGDTKTSTTVWQTWIEILGLDCIIIVKDSGTDQENPIGGYVVYKSRNDTITTVEKDKISDFLSENL